MKKIFLISIRYTLLSPSFVPKTFLQLERMGYEKFKDSMLDPLRLDCRLNLFLRYTLPSLKAFDREASSDLDDEVVFKVVLNASSLLPDKHKKKLREVARNNSFLDVVFSSEEAANIRKVTLNTMKKLHLGKDCVFLTMRMDDDDAISNSFYEKMKIYARKEFSGFGVSFPDGYIGYLDESGDLLGFRNYYKPKVAIGLCYVNFIDKDMSEKFKSVYCFGSHGRIDFKTPVIIDSSFKSFLRTAHLTSDVYSDKDKYQREVELIDNKIVKEVVFSSFPVSP